MKSACTFGTILLFCGISSLTSCNDSNREGRTVTAYSEHELTVASRKVPGVLWSDGRDFLTEVYAVKEGQSDEWSPFGNIDGFGYEKGYEYRIWISETDYLDYSMGQPAWTERDLLEVMSKEKKDSENLPLHFIPEAYYESIPLPQYRYAADAEDKELIEQYLKDNPLIPLESHAMLYRGEDSFLRWIALQDDGGAFGPYIIKTMGKDPEEMPESYKLLPAEAQIAGYGEWRFSDDSGNAIDNLSFDVFIGYATRTKSDMPAANTVYLCKDMTEYCRNKYPEAGVKTAAVSYAITVSGLK